MSAAKYRQKRKIYVDGLEDHVRKLNEQLDAHSKTITSLKTENQMLKDQVTYLKKLVDSFRGGKTPVQSISPINRSIKMDSFGKAIKPMGAGLFLLAICLVFSLQPDKGINSMSLPVRSASRTLLHHIDDHNDSIPFLSVPTDSTELDSFTDSTEHEPPNPIVETVLTGDLAMEPPFEVIENIVTRHGFSSAAAA